MNVIDWMNATAAWMFADRPDLYSSAEHAFSVLDQWMETIRYDAGFGGGIETGGFLLTHSNEDGVEEWQLFKAISACAIAPEDDYCDAWGLLKDSGTISVGINLPDIMDDEGLDI